MLLAGLMSAGVCTFAHTLGALGSGVVGGLPVVAAWTWLATQRHSGPAAAQRYARAYRQGLGARSVMNAVFLAGAAALGAGWAMALALLASALVIAWPRWRAVGPAAFAPQGR